MKKRTFQLLVAVGGLFLWGCYPDGPDYIEELDVVITNYNPDYDFSTVVTYAIPDKIIKITGEKLENGEEPKYLPQSAAILAKIKENLNALGWQEVDFADTATGGVDVFVLPASWETTTIFYYYDYWYWWYGGYYPYWGYYPPVYYSSYTTGTLFWTLMDPNNLDGSGNPLRGWTAAINGLLTGSFNTARAEKGIDQAFAQSPYLLTN